MKKIFAVVSLALMMAACTSTRGKLLSRIEYNGDGSVFKRVVYHYSGDELALVTRVIYSNNVPDSSWTEYEIRHNGQITDTIETTNSIKRTIKSSDGSIRSYHLVGDEWKEEYYSKRDGKGRIIEYHSGDYHRWYSFDAQGRPAGDNYEFVNDNDQIQRGGNIGSGCDIEYGWDEQIPDNSFKGLLSLETAVISEDIKTIGRNAFEWCPKLKTIEVRSLQPPSIAPNTFNESDFVLIVPKGRKKTYKKAIGWNVYKIKENSF
jgi:hypothetical protein